MNLCAPDGKATRSMSISTATALVLALVSTTLTNLAYLREHDAAAELPVLSMRRPLQSARILLSDRSWMLGFVMETAGFLLYAAALALASLALVQSVAAGGIGVLAFFSIGDISTKVATQGGPRAAFVLLLILGYTAGTALLQVGYQAGAALTVAGLATLLTNAMPIAAETIVLDEPVPGGGLGVLRVLAFAAVTLGGVLLARPKESS
jgi:hypothetical protein